MEQNGTQVGQNWGKVRQDWTLMAGKGGQDIFAIFLVCYRAIFSLSNGIYHGHNNTSMVYIYNMHMAKLYGPSGILARTRVVVKAKAYLPYCFI